MIASRRITAYRAKKLMDNNIFLVMGKYCSVVVITTVFCVLVLKCNF